MTFISELYKITSTLLKSPFPEKFDKLPIHSRIKVVQTQIIKSHFYAANKQNEKLNQSLDELIGWIRDNRHLREFTCEERDIYRIEPLCESETSEESAQQT